MTQKIHSLVKVFLVVCLIPAMALAHGDKNHSFEFGGGGVAFTSNTDVLNDTAGGTVKVRYHFMDFLALELSSDFYNLPVTHVDDKTYETLGFLDADADGDIFAIPLMPTVLIYLPEWKNIHPYLFGGVGYQFNEADFDVDVTTAPGSVTTFEGKIEDSHIGVFGVGMDIALNDHCFLNVDARYQSAEFDLDTVGIVDGALVVAKERGENFDSVVFRLSVLYRF